MILTPQQFAAACTMISQAQSVGAHSFLFDIGMCENGHKSVSWGSKGLYREHEVSVCHWGFDIDPETYATMSDFIAAYTPHLQYPEAKP